MHMNGHLSHLIQNPFLKLDSLFSKGGFFSISQLPRDKNQKIRSQQTVKQLNPCALCHITKHTEPPAENFWPQRLPIGRCCSFRGREIMHNGLVSETRIMGSKSNGRKWELVLLTMRIVAIARVTTRLTLEVQEVLRALADYFCAV